MPRQNGKTVRKSSTNKYAKRRRSRRKEAMQGRTTHSRAHYSLPEQLYDLPISATSEAEDR